MPERELLPLDRWALARLDDVVTRVRRAYEEYEFHLVYHALVDFCASDLSAVYFDILKDRLYTWKAAATRGGARRRCSTAILRDVTRLLAPVTASPRRRPGSICPAARAVGLPGRVARAPPAAATRC